MSYKRNRKRKPITLDDALIRMSGTIDKLEEIIMTSEDDNKVINASNALSGVVSRLAKVMEVHSLEKRIKELEEKQKLRKVS